MNFDENRLKTLIITSYKKSWNSESIENSLSLTFLKNSSIFWKTISSPIPLNGKALTCLWKPWKRVK
jgi:hypothetical protein